MNTTTPHHDTIGRPTERPAKPPQSHTQPRTATADGAASRQNRSEALVGTLTADIAQLTRPIHVALQGRLITHPPLLDQLRDACTPGRNGSTGTTRTAPCSRPPARLDTIDALADIYVGISVCHARLALPSPPRSADWQKGVLQLMADAAPTLNPELADWLALEVAHWWRTAAVTTGWRPEQLRKLR